MPGDLVEVVARGVRRDRMQRTGAGRAYDPDVPPSDGEILDARAALKAIEEAGWGPREELEEALVSIQQWAQAYPDDIFIEPDLKAARAALESAGISMDGLHGSWGRRLLKGVGEIADKALAASPSPLTGETL